MDLPAYGRVLWRRRGVVLAGAALAVVLAVLSYYRVDFDSGLPTFQPRKAELWQSQANVFLTEGGFPAGRRTIPLVTKVIGGETVAVPLYNDPGRFASLSSLYARLAQSDQVRAIIEKQGKLRGLFQAVPTTDTTLRSGTLPIVSLFGKASTPGAAQATVTRGLEAFLTYVRSQQRAARIPENQRVQLRVLNAPQPAVLVEPRKKTLPFVVFLAVMVAAIGLVFILENAARSRPHVEVAPIPPKPAPGTAPQLEPEAEPEPEPEVGTIRRWA